MRPLLLLLAFGILAFAGCLSDDSAGTQSGPAEPTPPAEGESAAPEEETPQFCESESGCAFWDEEYHEYVVYEVDTAEIEVLIVPPASPFALRDIETLRAAVEAWGAGIQELAAPWMAENFSITTYVIGQDTPPQSALMDPEIIVVAAEYNPVLLFGIGLEPKQLACSVLGEGAERVYPSHAHDGLEILAADCTGVGFTCVALNTNFLQGGERRMYDLVAHEFGHCLGGGHVGDALDFRAKRVPVEDIMSYQNNPEQVHCVSNLNVRVLEGVYGSLLGQPAETQLLPGAFFTMPAPDYYQVTCANPAA